MTDSKYFATTKRGEIHELQEELNHQKEDKRKEAVKKVIAAMTVGKDVSSLFTDVLNCIQTTNLELKKLVYLYVLNHAKMQSDRAILAVNSFQRDASDPNPLIRALAIRTMGCIRVDKVVEYLCEPLRFCLKDRDPYVRKTAAICVAKLYDMAPELVETQGFLEQLTGLLSDTNPTVVANAVAALSEIDSNSSTGVFKITPSNVSKLQSALNECTEWGQVYILNSLARYEPQDAKDAESIVERVAPRLNHANAAVVLAAIKVLMIYLEYIPNQETSKDIGKKMARSLITLLTTKDPEIQYITLRNINLIVQKRPHMLSNDLRVFFIKFNDPIYVKMEKLEILIMLASEKNIDQVLSELKEAASEVDVEFVRKAVRAIGRCAIKIEKASERCIQVLLELIQTKVNYVVQEAIIVIKDIFRKYPNRYESIIATLCENLDTLDEPEAKASMIWIIGEYAERIENADELLETFLETYHDENPQVQLTLLTAIVKLFLKKPKTTQEMVQKVLNLATQETDNPDLRDRGYVYWRLLSTDPEAAKTVVLGEKPLISDNSSLLDPSLLNQLIYQISTLASVYHKPPESFVSKLRDLHKEKKEKKKKPVDYDEDSLLGSSSHNEPPASQPNLLDLGDLGGSLPNLSQAPKSSNFMDDLFDTTPTPQVSKSAVVKTTVLEAQKGGGLQIDGAFSTKNGQPVLELTFFNRTNAPMTGFAIQFNVNSFALGPSQPSIPVLNPGQSIESTLSLLPTPKLQGPPPLNNTIQIAIKNNVSIFYFQMVFPIHILFVEGSQMDRTEYLNKWRGIAQEHFKDVILSSADPTVIQKKLEAYRYVYMATRNVNGQNFLYFYAALPNNVLVFVEISVGPSGAKSCVKTSNIELVPLVEQSLAIILR